MEEETARLHAELEGALGRGAARPAASADLPTLWVRARDIRAAAEALHALPVGAFPSLLDVTWVQDERGAALVYLFRSLARPADLRLKVLADEDVPSLAPVFQNAAGYEAELEQAGRATFLPAGRAGSGAARRAGAPPLHGEQELALVLALERLAGIEAPPRAQHIRVLRAELLRLESHFRWYGAFCRDVGARAAAFYANDDAARAGSLAAAVAGTAPDRFLVGGERGDLPAGWEDELAAFIEEFEARLFDYGDRLLASGALQERTKGVSPLSAADALAFGLTGPVLRASGESWDLRARRPYAAYGHLPLRVPAGLGGDCYDRARVRLDEMQESLRLLARCAEQMPDGAVRASEPSRPAVSEATALVESSRGEVVCMVADGAAGLRVHLRSPTSPHLQASEALRRGCGESEASVIHGSLNPGVGL